MARYQYSETGGTPFAHAIRRVVRHVFYHRKILPKSWHTACPELFNEKNLIQCVALVLNYIVQQRET